MVVAQDLGVARGLVRAFRVVPMHLLEAVVEAAALANTMGLGTVEGLDQVQVLVKIVRMEDLAMENLPVLVVPEAVPGHGEGSCTGSGSSYANTYWSGPSYANANANGNGAGKGNGENGGSGGGQGAGSGFGDANP